VTQSTEEGQVFVFVGTATVSVTCSVEASSEAEARAMLEAGDCEWECEEVDGDVGEVELVSVDGELK